MDIADSIARTLFVTAWADRQEERGKRFPPGTELMDVAPKTPQYAKYEAWRLIGKIELLNEMNIHSLFAQAVRAEGFEDYYGGDLPEGAITEDTFGHLVAMESLGHGVGLADDYPKAAETIKLPLIEFMLN